MTYVQAPGYQEQRFLNLEGLDGLSPTQIAEHLALYAGYVKQVNVLNDQLAALRSQGRPRAETPNSQSSRGGSVSSTTG